MNGTVSQSVLLAASFVAVALAGIRWLRVAQREHYLPGSVLRFAGRWWSLGPNRLLAAAAVVGLGAAAVKVTPAGLVAAAAVACGPFGLTLRGRTSKLAWTRRLRTIAATAAVLIIVLVVLAGLAQGLALAAAVATLLAVAAPLIVDASLAITAPVERRLANRYVTQAAAKLKRVSPIVVAVTGSYGKTGTKGYIAHLLDGKYSVVATPASFNNRAGLARAINEHLAPGTDVFVAEMGTYGPGEIAEMCKWVRPDVAVITAIGPVHLERMGTEERIAQAKSEILQQAPIAVLNVDSPHLARIADRLAGIHPNDPARHATNPDARLWRCSAVDRRADVCVVEDQGTLRVFARTVTGAGGAGHEIARVADLDAPPTNVACAVAVALELGVNPGAIAARLGDLPTAPHRRQLITHRTGATVIDDTYNANPAGATAALHLLTRLAVTATGRRVVVTPGMVELGSQQADENAKLGEAAAKVATDIVIVGQTNAPALLAGVSRAAGTGGNGAAPRLVRVATRQQAVAWVSEHVNSGDAVLYENDLPDHFP